MSNEATSPPEPSELVGTRVRDARKRLGWSVDDLASACARAGFPDLTPNVIYLIEGGGRGKSGKRSRRRVTIDEVYALAMAFDVTPLLLLLPADGEDAVTITPTIQARAEDTFRWLTGRVNSAMASEDAARAERWDLVPAYARENARAQQVADSEVSKLVAELSDGLALLRELKADKSELREDGSL